MPTSSVEACCRVQEKPRERRWLAQVGSPRSRFPMQFPGRQDDPAQPLRPHPRRGQRSTTTRSSPPTSASTRMGGAGLSLPPSAPVRADLGRPGGRWASALPTAMGVGMLAEPDRTVVASPAYRSSQMNIQEFATLAEEAQRQDRAEEQQRARPGIRQTLFYVSACRLEVPHRARLREDRRGSLACRRSIWTRPTIRARRSPRRCMRRARA